MGKNSLGQTTVPVVAKRRISYHERLVVAGERFECDEQQAKAWVKTGVVAYVQERPNFKAPAVPPPDPVVAKVLQAEAPKPDTPAPPPPAESTAAAETTSGKSPTAVEPMSMPEPDAPLASAARTGHYSRRDMRSKP